MRFVTVPAPVKIVNLATGQEAPETWTIWLFLAALILPDPKIGKGREGAKTAKRLRRMFEPAQPGDVIAIDSVDRDAVCRVQDEPTAEWNQANACQLEEFMAAFVDAPEECPQKPLSEAPPSMLRSLNLGGAGGSVPGGTGETGASLNGGVGGVGGEAGAAS